MKYGLFDFVFVWAGDWELFECGDLQIKAGRFADAGTVLLRSMQKNDFLV